MNVKKKDGKLGCTLEARRRRLGGSLDLLLLPCWQSDAGRIEVVPGKFFFFGTTYKLNGGLNIEDGKNLRTWLSTDVLTQVQWVSLKIQPKGWHSGISHWQNFGLLIFAKFGLPVSFFHCLETETNIVWSQGSSCFCRGFGHQVPVPRKLSFRTTASFVKCNLMVPWKMWCPLTVFWKWMLLAAKRLFWRKWCALASLARYQNAARSCWEGFDLDRMQLKSVEPLPSGQVAAQNSR